MNKNDHKKNMHEGSTFDEYLIEELKDPEYRQALFDTYNELLTKLLEDLENENDRLRKALKFYGNKEHYKDTMLDDYAGPDMEESWGKHILTDKGQIARDTLQENQNDNTA